MRVVIGGQHLTRAAGLKYVMQESNLPARLWRTIFLTLSAAILFCVLGAVWALTQPDKKLAFGESNTLRMTVSSVADHE
jgi:hypothetical protein